MAAALLTDEPVILENIPQVRDIETTRRLLSAMGAEVELGYGRAQHRTTICAQTLAAPEASYELVKTMRASTLVLGPLVALAVLSVVGGYINWPSESFGKPRTDWICCNSYDRHTVRSFDGSARYNYARGDQEDRFCRD